MFGRILEWLREIWFHLKSLLRMLLGTNLPRVVMLLTVVLFGGGIAIMVVERGHGAFTDFFSSVWWALVTMTTVGYGDMVPTTIWGRVIAAGVILAGVILVSTFTATISSIFVAAKIREGKGLQQIRYRDHIVVCGAGFIARQMFDALIRIKAKDKPKVVVVADIPAVQADELLAHYELLHLRYIRGNWTHEEVLKRANVMESRMVIILPDETLDDTLKMDEKTVLATLTVKALHPKVKLIAHIMKRDNRVFLQRAKADEILVSDEFTGYMLATNTIASGVNQMINEMLSFEGGNLLSGFEIPAEFIGRPYGELVEHFFRKESILIGLAREENPLEAADILSADSSALDDFIRRKFQEAGIGDADQKRPHARLNPPYDTLIHKHDKAVVIQRVKEQA